MPRGLFAVYEGLRVNFTRKHDSHDLIHHRVFFPIIYYNRNHTYLQKTLQSNLQNLIVFRCNHLCLGWDIFLEGFLELIQIRFITMADFFIIE
jgi:hypothetical protein